MKKPSIWLFLFLIFPLVSQAHILKLSDSELILQGREAVWEHRVHQDDFDVKFGRVGEEDLKAYIPQKLGLDAAGVPCEFERIDFRKVPAQEGIVLRLAYRCASEELPVKVRYDLFYGDPSHRHLMKITAGPHGASFTFDPGQIEFQLEKESLGATMLSFLKLGLEHILIGYDHILFVLALIFGARRFRDLVWLVTSFTLAHSFTLALSTLNILTLPPEIVEPIIAASIVFLALLDLRGERRRPAMVALTFAFGLIHGLGFAYILQEARLEAGHLAVPLIFFNLGVEVGQLLIVALVYPLTLALKKWLRSAYRYFRTAALLAIGGMGLYWFLERIWF